MAVAGGGCPYQVSAGRQKEEAAAAIYGVGYDMRVRFTKLCISSSTKKNKGKISHLGREISPRIFGKGKKSIDLETVVLIVGEKKLHENEWCCSVFARSKIQNNEALAAKPIGSTSMVVSGPGMDGHEA